MRRSSRSENVLDAEAFVPADVVELALWTAEYYAAGPGDTITVVLPPMARGGRADAHKTIRVASITAAGLDHVGQPFQGRESNGGPGRLRQGSGESRQSGAEAERPALQVTAKQREALEALPARPTAFPHRELSSRGIAADVVARLVRHGFVSVRQDRVDRDPFETAVCRPWSLIPPGA